MSFSLRFRLRPDYSKNRTKPLPIQVTVRINGVDSTPRSLGNHFVCHKKDWIIREFDRWTTSEDLNALLFKTKEDLSKLFTELSLKDQYLTPNQFLNRWKIGGIDPYTLNIYDLFLKELRKRIAKEELKEVTYQKYVYFRRFLAEFIQHHFKRKDIEAVLFTNLVGRKFKEWLEDKHNQTNNHSVRQVKRLRIAFEFAAEEEILKDNPLEKYRAKQNNDKEILCLDDDQMQKLCELKTTDVPLQKAIDLFTFICFTGFDYQDTVRFDANKHLDNDLIVIERDKGNSKGTMIIPILPKAREILEKYDYKLPFLLNATINKLLKTVAELIEFPYKLVCKSGRKTAGTYLLNNDVPIETVSKILGHRSVKTTQIYYAKVLNKKVIRNSLHLINK